MEEHSETLQQVCWNTDGDGAVWQADEWQQQLNMEYSDASSEALHFTGLFHCSTPVSDRRRPRYLAPPPPRSYRPCSLHTTAG
jgi:hypothetical protein